MKSLRKKTKKKPNFQLKIKETHSARKQIARTMLESNSPSGLLWKD